MNARTLAYIRSFVGTDGQFSQPISVTQGISSIDEAQVVKTNVLPVYNGTNAGTIIVGDLRTAVSVGVGRDMTIEANDSVLFNSDQTVWKIKEDFCSAVVQSGAVVVIDLVA
jgi:HK97 family phage major capsid protein